MTEKATEQELDFAAAPALVDESQRRRGMLFICLMVAAAGFALALQMGMNENFLKDEIGIGRPEADTQAAKDAAKKDGGWKKGISEAVRESCGIVAFAGLAAMAGMSEPIVAMLMLLVAAVGLGSYAYVPDFTWVLLMSLLWSQGLHVWFPLPDAMTLSLAEPHRRGWRMGQRRAAEAVGTMGGFLVGMAVTLTFVRLGQPAPIRPLFLVAGAAFVLAAGACVGIPRRLKTPGPRFCLRRKYRLYYVLSFLEGWRKQIFLCFAGWLLVQEHGVVVWQMLALWSVVHAMGFFTGPLVGRLIDRVGERPVLMVYFSLLTACFVCYAYVPDTAVLCGIFVFDNALFVMDMARTTYVGRIAPAGDRTATLSMGVAFNHVAAVILPLVGGLLWAGLGYQWTFLLGAAAAGVSVYVSSFVPRREAAVVTSPAS